MDARVLVTENQKGIIIPFPRETETREIDLTFAKIANKKSELIERENVARNYSAKCEAKRASKLIDMDDVWCFVSALSVFAFVVAMYFVGIVLM